MKNNPSHLFISKTKASAIHFGISLFIFSIFIGILLYFWYPEPYFSSSGGWQGLKLTALVDLVLGPTLTFVIFNPSKSKKELTKDISIIALLQFTVLFWGIYTVYLQRPIALVFWEDSIYTISDQTLKTHYKNHPLVEQIQKSPRKFYYVQRPSTVEGLQKLQKTITKEKIPPYQLINRFSSFSDNFNYIKSQSIDINEIVNANTDMKAELNTILKTTNTHISDNYYLPLIAKYQNIILVFKSTGILLGHIKAPYKPNV